MRFVPCSASSPRSASPSRRPALRAGIALSGSRARNPVAQAIACRRYAAPRAEHVGEVVGDHRGHPAWPHQAPDHDADGASDRDVLDPHQADGPSNRHEQVEQHRDRDRERGLTDLERQRAGRDAATSTAIGSATHSAVVLDPIATSSAPPTTNPIAVPVSARNAVAPVAAAFVRSTDRVPSTTQNPCWTLLRSATATAAASAIAPRRLFTSQTELRLASRRATAADRDTRRGISEPS